MGTGGEYSGGRAAHNGTLPIHAAGTNSPVFRGHGGAQRVRLEPMISAFFKALGDLGSPRFRKVLWHCALWSFCTAAVLWGAVWWLMLNTELIGELPWVGGLAEDASDFLAIFIAFFLMILLLPAFLGIYASLYIETICRAVEMRHYPELAPPRDQGISEAIWVGVKFGLFLIVLNLFLLVFLIFPPLYFVLGWGINGYLLGREYLEMVGFRRMTPRELRDFRMRHRGRMYLAGLIFALIATIPIVNLLLPLFGTAMMLHVYERHRPKGGDTNATITIA